MKRKIITAIIALLIAIALVGYQRVYAADSQVVATIYSDGVKVELNTENKTKPVPLDGEVEVGVAPTEEETTETAAHEYTAVFESMTDEEYELLRKIVAAESQTQELAGRIAVVEVIFNRCIGSTYPDTVYEVLSQKGQFVTWKYRNSSWVEPEYADEAIAYVVENGLTVLPDTEYEYFSRGRAKWAKEPIKIGDHYFYKL